MEHLWAEFRDLLGEWWARYQRWMSYKIALTMTDIDRLIAGDRNIFYRIRQNALAPECVAWCEENLVRVPMVHPEWEFHTPRPVTIGVYFANKNDALAFKMRWL